MKHFCNCGELLAIIEDSDHFTTFGRRLDLNKDLIEVKCKKCRETTIIKLIDGRKGNVLQVQEV